MHIHAFAVCLVVMLPMLHVYAGKPSECASILCASVTCPEGYIPYQHKRQCCRYCRPYPKGGTNPNSCSKAYCPPSSCTGDYKQYRDSKECCPVCKLTTV